MKAFCPFCEKEYNNLEVQTRYEITTLNGVTAEWQKKYITCPDCGEELYNAELYDANLRVVYAACKVTHWYKPVEDLCDYVSKLRIENAALRMRLEQAIELPYERKRLLWGDKDKETLLCPDCLTDIMGGFGDETLVVQCPNCGCFINSTIEPIDFTAETEARLKEIKENTELRERSKNVVELPCGLGDTIYTVIKNCAHCKHYNMGWAECRAPATASFDCESTHRICFTQDIIDDECRKHLCVAKLEFDLGLLDPKTGELEPQYFIDREAAEVLLREIQGEEI